MVKSFCDRCGLACEPRKVTISWNSHRYTGDSENKSLDLCERCFEKVDKILSAILADRVEPNVKET